MTYAEALKKIMARSGARDNEEQAKEALNEALEDLENQTFLPWFLLTPLTYTTLKEGKSLIPLPVAFIRGYEEGELYRQEENGKLTPLKKGLQEDVAQGVSIPGVPSTYSLNADYYRLAPHAAEDTLIAMSFYKRTDKLWDIAGYVDPWLQEAGTLVVAAASILIMTETRDVKGLEIQEKVYKEKLKILMTRDVARREANLHLTLNQEC